MTILSDRDVTPEERAAIADEPRPGVWLEGAVRLDGDEAPEEPGDGRRLTQLQTDTLIVSELRSVAVFGPNPEVDVDELNDLFGERPPIALPVDHGFEYPLTQRGGIHSDKLARLLAFRAWGDRDRVWRNRDTVSARFPSRVISGIEVVAMQVYGWDSVAIAWPELTADRGGRVASALIEGSMPEDAVNVEEEQVQRILDAFDELDAKLAAGGEPLQHGP